MAFILEVEVQSRMRHEQKMMADGCLGVQERGIEDEMWSEVYFEVMLEVYVDFTCCKWFISDYDLWASLPGW